MLKINSNFSMICQYVLFAYMFCPPIRFVRRYVLSADTCCRWVRFVADTFCPQICFVRRYVLYSIRFVAYTFCPPIRFVSDMFCRRYILGRYVLSRYILSPIRFVPIRFVPIHFVHVPKESVKCVFGTVQIYSI
jgi:hypothetical protein